MESLFLCLRIKTGLLYDIIAKGGNDMSNKQNKMINYANEIIEYSDCPGCAYANQEFSLPCGMAYENSSFTLSQDWELPITGFFVLTPKKCIEKLNELTREERIEMFDLLNETIVILRENKVCDRFEIVFEEKENRHLHIWIMPRHKWMKELVGDIIDNIGQVFEYAKSNFKTEIVFKEIEKITEIVRKEFNQRYVD
jgi:diadenosine tetraphosphate (Ap4A) HIT family hydrolase